MGELFLIEKCSVFLTVSVICTLIRVIRLTKSLICIVSTSKNIQIEFLAYSFYFSGGNEIELSMISKLL